MKVVYLTALLMIVNISLMSEPRQIELPSLFSDNMVLQQNELVPFWGKGEPGSTITISTGWNESASVICENDSNWNVKIHTPAAGGPFEIVIQQDDANITLKNVMIGEVWLCSGQSNMEMPLGGWPPNDLINNSTEEIKNANYPGIRMFTVTRSISMLPKDDCVGQWSICSPNTAPNFSATAFFFGKKLFKELNVPVGLIHSSWGGTPAEAWTSKKHLKNMEEFLSTLKAIEHSLPALEKLNSWLEAFPRINMADKSGEDTWKNLEFDDIECPNSDYDDSKWLDMTLPILWERTDVKEFDGVVWFRKKIEIPGSWIGKEMQISLGPIDDYDRTYVNGSLVGAIEVDGNYQTNRIYDIPVSINNSNEVCIAVRVMDNRGGGGIYGKADLMKLTLKSSDENIAISGLWKYLPVAEFRSNSFFVFGPKNQIFKKRPELPIEVTASTPTTLYNGMIAPLIPYSIKGAIWYQGEANVDRPEQYEILFPEMITNWREDWDYDFPFYFVQIAPYNYGENSPSEYLRDAQRKTLSLKNTGMVVTIDIGNNNNIHPANKKDVGDRLAFWALSKDYDKNIIPSGPLYKSMEVTGDKIVLTFDYTGDGLELKSADKNSEFLIAGQDKVFKPATVEIKNNKLIVYNKDISEPAAVRYSWSNTSGATLFNKNGLPASSFRTDDWKR